MSEMQRTDTSAEAAITQEAADWFIAHRAGGLSMSDRAQFIAWLKASPLHIQEYLAVSNASRNLGEAARRVEVELEEVLSAARESPANVVTWPEHPRVAAASAQRRVRARKYAMAAACAMLLLVPVLWHVWGILPKTYQTAHAEQSSWRLPDGSVMHLNSETRVSVHFSEHERRVDLERGQAHFQVTRDPQRRFRVASGGTDIIAVGTAFDVYRKRDATVVTVVEGKVAVVAQHAREAGTAVDNGAGSNSPNAPADRIELTAGQRVEMKAASASTPVSVSVRESTAWLQREIVFEREPLAGVVTEFNRYSRVPIEIQDPALGDLRLSGAFNAYDTESFIGFLRRLDGVVVETDAERIVVRR